MTFLEGKGLVKKFGGVAAVSNVSFHIDRDEIVGLIGPNGAGKTTLFNLICGVYPPSSGMIIFEGGEISGLKPYRICRKGIARTFQLTKSFINLSVVENVMVGVIFGKEGRENLKSARERAMQLIEFGGLTGKADLPASSLIQVDARRLELIRALATTPKLLLLDEVMAGLNPSDITKAIDLIRRIRDKLGVTILMVEHVMASIMSVSDRVIVLANGRIVRDGTPLEVCEDPAVIEVYLGKAEYDGR